MGEINQRQLKNYKEQGYLVGDEIGQSGLERRWEDVLRGQHGGQQVEVDALGRRVRVLHEVNDVPGYTVHLTLDRQMQQTAYEALKGKEGTIVAIDVNSGRSWRSPARRLSIRMSLPAASKATNGTR